ncbi:PRC-barrel domain-containing protein [Roseobacter sinensis]|uniref:PRC-barrel domain-containing protein n=1 Tax=Roseobacter sinensis TaxID=2931391 RepID=A0ABT3B8T4_9RHOB|nr:PRC-barrel domain-containing protein [Roseobacter sp. WL0113]MCV3269982.1 PRC-barrel domain-containing protein [Roseobacter sp. WL0113]
MTHLKATVAILALTAGTALAGTSVSPEAEITAETAVENAAQETQELAGDAAEATEDAIDATTEAASDAAQAVEDTAEGAVAATTDAVEEATDYATDTPDPNAEAEMSGMVVGDLIGMDVAEANGDVIGEIDYVVREGDALAAVIGIGGFLGFGEYTVAIPLSEFSMAGEDGTLKLASWTEAELEAQPEFDETGIQSVPEDMVIDQIS